MNEELKIMYGLLALLLASGLLTYLTRNLNPTPVNEAIGKKKHNKKRRPKSELQLLRDQDTPLFRQEGPSPLRPNATKSIL
ncbi:hypothetical protein SD10_07540 [Spirosoma radiotolerans]|uniref:Uncharacterized protein n=1 Tax=Spirosoma radiotolerans TaxID=1379870 RepID=A0A0E3ZUX2_9BACT|nr:hypothetical protein SD10_07540 [Spirosoma radiotolerans]